jgi:hypothetical protein
MVTDTYFVFSTKAAPARPDFVIRVRERAVLFGMYAGPNRASSTTQVNWDLYELVRFGKQLVDSGDMALLLQVIHDRGTFMRLTAPVKGMYLLSSVGLLKVPIVTHNVPGFAATLPVAEAMMVRRICASDCHSGGWSWMSTRYWNGLSNTHISC